MKIKDLIFKIENINLEQTLTLLVQKAEEKDGKTFVVTINPEIIMLAKNDEEYERVLTSADLALPDGIGVIWAAKIFGKKLSGRIHGVDLMEKLSEKVSKKSITVGFVGGREGVAAEAAARLKDKYPGLKVAFSKKEWEKGMSSDILFVAFGSPKQELWIADNLSKINVKVAVGVGGSFDFISGRVVRAPVFLRKLGLEWLFRLIIQPWRVRRQLRLPLFVFEVLRERF